jgi:hypothetical protein
MPQELPQPYHSMQIYRDESTLARIVSRLVVQALQLRQPALIMAVPSCNEKIIAGLAAEGVAVEKLRTSGDVQIADAQQILDRLLVNGMPDAQAFKSVVGGLLARLCQGREPCFPLIYTDMAGLLIGDDNTAAAIAMELLWNRLARHHQFSLTCGYTAAALSERVPSLEELQAICAHHNVVRSLPN